MENWSIKVDKSRVGKTIAALRANNIEAELVADGDSTLARLKQLIPKNSQVHQGASVTLEQTGITDLIENSGQYSAVRPTIHTMNRAKDADEIRQLGASPQYMLGSVHAASEAGHLYIASASGSQLPAEAAGAEYVIWVVGTQKIVKDRAEAFDRIERYVFPKEDARAVKAYGLHSSINKILIVQKEPFPGRSRVIFIDQAIGY